MMHIEALPDDFARWIGDFLRLNVEENEDSFVYSNKLGKSVDLEKLKLRSLIAQLESKEERDNTAIYDGHTYEVLIKQNRPSSFTSTPLKKKDPLNGITYTLSRPSDEYLLFLLYKLSRIVSIEYLELPSYRGNRLDPKQSVLELLRKSDSQFLTLKIDSVQSKSDDDLVKYATAYLFELSYNLGTAFIAPKYFNDLIRRGRFRRQNRRAKPKEILVPRRFYNSDLAYYYQLALATEAPSLEYLSYYHILEYFGESIFVADMVKRVKQIITQPGFSYRRDADIEQLIKDVEKLPKTTPRSTNDAKRDERALRMTLERYVKVTELLEKLKDYDSSLVTYYRDDSVPFVNKASAVNLESNDSSQVLAHLARRIYRTRNAIVHSKEAEQSRYMPFRDDVYLVKEIPLLRFCAELIILKSSDIIPN